MKEPRRRSGEMGGPDPIDSALEAGSGATTAGRLRFFFHSRAALGLAPAAAPALIFVPLGIVLGPAGLGLLSEEALAHLDTVVSLGLAALGVFIGLGLEMGRAERRLLAAASVESLVTVALVAFTTAFLLASWDMRPEVPAAVLALALGIVASASSAGAAEEWHDGPHHLATRIADLDDVAPILIGGFVIVAAAHGSFAPSAVVLTAVTIAVGVAAAIAGWLLFERASGEAERAVFVAGSVLLLAGCAAYLGLSPLLAGLAAGVCWGLLPGQADHIVREDLRKFQHPLVVVLLVVAGATLSGSSAGVWLLAPFLCFRLAGKLIGGWFASRLAPGLTPSHLGSYLIAPGVLGIAFALNFLQVSPSRAGEALLFAAAVGSLVNEAIALAAMPPARRG
ncbi:MAG TPA: hypothetical protein VMR21_17500 [Vicinamibacteria bacterium]|nr:hypothetical protein [Vicinamibacteria bacterium]